LTPGSAQNWHKSGVNDNNNNNNNNNKKKKKKNPNDKSEKKKNKTKIATHFLLLTQRSGGGKNQSRDFFLRGGGAGGDSSRTDRCQIKNSLLRVQLSRTIQCTMCTVSQHHFGGQLRLRVATRGQPRRQQQGTSLQCSP
jgi:hypothetical protein